MSIRLCRLSRPRSGVYRSILLGLFGLTASSFAFAQSAPSPSPILSQAFQAFSSGKSVASVEMTGTAHWIVGPDKDSGPVRLVAKITGENTAEFDLSNGTRIESQSAITDDRTCTWSGKDGVSHNVDTFNCLTATVWFLPHMTLQSSGLPTQLGVASAGLLADKNASVPHIRHQLMIAQGAKPEVTELMQSWSQTDLSLDPVSFLPNSLKYTIHPDKRSHINLQVEVRYSQYQTVSGVALPMHIERYVNGNLQTSIDVVSATIN